MARRSGPKFGSANKAYAEVELPDDLVPQLIGKLNVMIDDAALEIAQEIKSDAQASTAFKDYTGTARESEYHKQKYPNATRLRPKMSARKSKYAGGGAIVVASAPHAHLVEYGHVLVLNGKVSGRVKEHPFIRPAKEKRLQEAINKFAEKLKEGLAAQ